MPQIYYLPDDRLIHTDEAETILQSSLECGIPHLHICGGSARCTTCRVLIIDGLEFCSDRTYAETLICQQLGFDERIRLACQTQIYGKGQVTVKRLTLDHEDVELIDDQLKGRRRSPSIGQEKLVAILFADLRGFTSFAEALPPYDVVYVLNRYFHQMGKAIEQQGGMINNYMGDGLMALFGWNDTEQAAERAVRAGLDMLQAMEQFNQYVESMYARRLKIGIGIHYGEAVLGMIGSAAHSQQMTAIGDAVNLASRIEAANKQLGTHLLISEAVYQHIQGQATIQPFRSIALPGKQGEYTLYEVTAIYETIMAEAAIDLGQKSALFQWRSVLKFVIQLFARLFARLFTQL